MKEQDLFITRVLDAPRKQVWKEWTKPERLMRWWGPKNYTSPSCDIDFRPGGKYLFCMSSPEGKVFWSTGIYVDIIHLEKIVYTDSLADENGNEVPPAHYGMSSDFPAESEVTLTFSEEGGKTTMTLRHAGIPLGEIRESARKGWNESFDKLAESLKIILEKALP